MMVTGLVSVGAILGTVADTLRVTVGDTETLPVEETDGVKVLDS